MRVPEEKTQGDGWRYESGTIVVDKPGAVVQGLATTATIEVRASDVVVRNCRIEVTGERWGVGLRSGRNIRVEDNTITSPAASGPDRLATGIYQMADARVGMIARGNDISHTSTGIIAEGGLVEGNFIHALGMKDGDHLNGVSSNGGSTVPLTIRGNTILNQKSQTDAIALFTDFGPQRDRRVEDNLIGGGAYTLYADGRDGRNIVVARNRFGQELYKGSGYYGPVAAYTDGPGNEFRDNVYDHTGGQVPANSS